MKETFPTGKQKKKIIPNVLAIDNRKLFLKKRKLKKLQVGRSTSKRFSPICWLYNHVLQFTEFYTNYDQADMMQ